MKRIGIKTTIGGIIFLLICVLIGAIYFINQSWHEEIRTYKFQLSHIVLESLINRDNADFDTFKRENDSLFSSFIRININKIQDGTVPQDSLVNLINASKKLYVNLFPGIDAIKSIALKNGLDSTFDIDLSMGFFEFTNRNSGYVNQEIRSSLSSNQALSTVFSSGKTLNKKYYIGGYHIRGIYFHYEYLCYLSPNNIGHTVFVRIWPEILILLLVTFVLVIFSILIIKSLIREKRLSNQKSAFINMITHEFNTPLATISIATKMLQKDEIDKEGTRILWIRGLIERQNKLLQQMINEIINKSQSDSIAEKLSKINPAVEIKKILQDFKILHQDVPFDLKENISIPEHAYIWFNESSFGTVLLNILDNAVKYKKKNIDLKITVSAYISKQWLMIEIKDNGIGLKKREIPYIFNRFYRGKNADMHEINGMGLGLYLVRKSVRRAKGKIIVDSVLGEGSNFKLKLPLAKN